MWHLAILVLLGHWGWQRSHYPCHHGVPWRNCSPRTHAKKAGGEGCCLWSVLGWEFRTEQENLEVVQHLMGCLGEGPKEGKGSRWIGKE